MDALTQDEPTVEAPRAAVRGARWVKPELVAEIAFAEITPDGVLRHSSFLGLRGDKKAAEVVVEDPQPAPAAPEDRGQGQQSRPRDLPREQAHQGRPR